MSYVNSYSLYNSTAGTGHTWSYTPSASGNILLAWFSPGQGTLTGVPTDGSNTWAALGTNPHGSFDAFNIYTFWAKSTGSSALTISVTTASSQACSMGIIELSGRDPTTPINAVIGFNESSRTNTHSTATPNGNLTTTVSGCDLVMLSADTASFDSAGGFITYTPTNSYTMCADGSGTLGTQAPGYTGCIQYLPNQAIGSSYLATFSNNVTTMAAAGVLVAVAPASGGGGTSARSLLTLGIG